MSLTHQVLFGCISLLVLARCSAADDHGAHHADGHGFMLFHYLKDILYPYLEEGVVICNLTAGFLIVASLAQSLINLTILASNRFAGEYVML